MISLFLAAMSALFLLFWKIEGWQRKREREYWDNPLNHDEFDNL